MLDSAESDNDPDVLFAAKLNQQRSEEDAAEEKRARGEPARKPATRKRGDTPTRQLLDKLEG